MRRHVVFSFIVVFWCLAVCTVLSAKIEEQMTAQVAKVESKEYMLPLDVLFEDENGMHLYEVVQSEGMENGKRVRENEEFWIQEDCVEILDEFATYIRYASKEIESGTLVEISPLYKGESAEYLVIDFGDTYVVSVEEGLQPFMQEAVKAELGLSKESTVYNMKDVRAFSKNFPVLGVILSALLASMILWVVSWKKKIPLFSLNTGICGVLFAVFYWFVQKIEIPDSLLAKWNILAFGYYQREISEVFHFLKEANEVMYQELVCIYMKNTVIFMCILLFIQGGIFAYIKVICKNQFACCSDRKDTQKFELLNLQ